MNSISQQEGIGFSTERIRRIFRQSWLFSCVIKEAYTDYFSSFIIIFFILAVRHKDRFFLDVERFRREPECKWSEYVTRLPAEIHVMIRNGPSTLRNREHKY